MKVASLPTKRSNFSLVSLGGKLLAAGGLDGSGYTDVVEVYHPELNKWQVVCLLALTQICFVCCGGGKEGAGQGGGGEVQVQEQELLDGRTDCRAVG